MTLRPLPRLKLWLLLGRLLILAIVLGSLLPLPSLGSDVPSGDKWQHGIGYFALAFWYAQLCATRAALARRALAFVALGAAIEWAQSFTTWRSGLDLHDVAANCVGVAIGAGLGLTPLGALLARFDRH